MRNATLILLTVLTLLATACSPLRRATRKDAANSGAADARAAVIVPSTSGSDGPGSVPGDPIPPAPPADPNACVRDLPQFELGVHIAAFDMVDDADIQIGLDGVPVIGPLQKIKFMFKRGRITLETEVRGPLDHVVARTATGKADQVTLGAGIEINLSLLKINPSYVYTTPLAQVTTKALADGVKNLQKATADVSWKGEVLSVQDGAVVLGGGSLAGMQVGDRFEIYGVQHLWSGAPCAGQYLGAIHSTDTPLAVVELTTVPDQLALAVGKVVQGSVRGLEHGDEARVSQLVPGRSARTLKSTVRVGAADSVALHLPDGSLYDLRDAIRVLARDAVSRSGFLLAD